MTSQYKVISALCALIVVLWVFPKFWYSNIQRPDTFRWFIENRDVVGWTFKEQPVAIAAERMLRADRLVNGQFVNGSNEIEVFSAKRFRFVSDDLGLFVHTPDRCWTEIGWKIERASPESVRLNLFGVGLEFERRVFTAGARRELVYFGGMVGGEAVPYRLDHNLSVGTKHAMHSSRDATGTTLRAADNRFWSRVWESFISRAPLNGPQQFIRISTTLAGSEPTKDDDRLLTEFLGHWLILGDFATERDEWKRANKQGLTANAQY